MNGATVSQQSHLSIVHRFKPMRALKKQYFNASSQLSIRSTITFTFMPRWSSPRLLAASLASLHVRYEHPKKGKEWVLFHSVGPTSAVHAQLLHYGPNTAPCSICSRFSSWRGGSRGGRKKWSTAKQHWHGKCQCRDVDHCNRSWSEKATTCWKGKAFSSKRKDKKQPDKVK
jgi:hypothetical protein